MKDGEHTVKNRIESLHVKGFRSLVDVRLDDIPNPMVLLDPNGADVLQFFLLLSALARRQLGAFVQARERADSQLHSGRERTKRIEAKVSSRTEQGNHTYAVTLDGTGANELTLVKEEFTPWLADGRAGFNYDPHSSRRESNFVLMVDSNGGDERSRATVKLLRDSTVYQFHHASPVRMQADAEDSHRLHGGNLAPILIRLRANDPPRYESICQHIRHVLPEFDRFEINVDQVGKVLLGWRDRPFNQVTKAAQTPDDSLLTFCLITLLNLPDELLPSIILLDVPRLRPAVASRFPDMVKAVKAMARVRQVVVTTRSSSFARAFNDEKVVVLTTGDGKTQRQHSGAH